jgi:hypothetical protein
LLLEPRLDTLAAGGGWWAVAMTRFGPLARRYEAMYRPEHPSMLTCRNLLAFIHLTAGRPDEGISIMEPIVAGSRSRLGLSAIAGWASPQASGDGIGCPLRHARKHSVR